MAENTYARWTPEEDDRMRKFFESGMSKFLVAAKLKRSASAVKGRGWRTENSKLSGR